MKTCPICNAVAFDDAVTCFGCLHDYSASEGGVGQNGSAEQPPETEVESDKERVDQLCQSPGAEHLAHPDVLVSADQAEQLEGLLEVEGDEVDAVMRLVEPERRSGPRHAVDGMREPSNPTFLIRLVPQHDAGTLSWSCAVELAAG